MSNNKSTIKCVHNNLMLWGWQREAESCFGCYWEKKRQRCLESPDAVVEARGWRTSWRLTAEMTSAATPLSVDGGQQQHGHGWRLCPRTIAEHLPVRFPLRRVGEQLRACSRLQDDWRRILRRRWEYDVIFYNTVIKRPVLLMQRTLAGIWHLQDVKSFYIV